MRRPGPWTVALAAVILVFLWEAATVHYNYQGNWTGLFFTGGRQALPAELASGTYVIPDNTGYDGQYYRIIAHDPFLKKGYDRYLDLARVRYRRILIPLCAWLLAGGTQWVDTTYILIVLLFVFLAVYWAARYLESCKRPAALGMVALLDPAILTSIDRMLLDGAITALVLGFLVAEREENRRLRYLTSMLAPLVKETGIVLCAAAVLADLWRRQYRRAIVSATAALPALAWFAYVEIRTGSPEPTQVFTLPVLGIIRRIFTFRVLPDPALQVAFRIVDLLSILGFAVTLWLAWVSIRKEGSTATAALMSLFLGMALVFENPEYLKDAYAYARPVSALLLFVMLRGVTIRKWRYLVPPLLVTLSIAIYFVKPFLGVLQGLL